MIFLPFKHSGKARQGTRRFPTLCVPLNLDLYDLEQIGCYGSGHREVVAPLNPPHCRRTYLRILPRLKSAVMVANY